MMYRYGSIFWLVVAMFALPAFSLAEEDEDGELEEELSELKDADYPDLVAHDETGALMDEFALLEEELQVYSAAKHMQKISESPSSIFVITRGRIANTHCTDVVCLLRQVPGMNVHRYGPLSSTVGVRSVEGTMGEKILVLVDGREINIEVFGFPLWAALPVALEDIERIEVVRGPGSSLYGANAHSGVVAISTRAVDADRAEVFLVGGEYDRSLLHLRLGKRLGAWRLGVLGGLETAGHWRLRGVRDQELYRVRLQARHQGEESTTRLHAGMTSVDGQMMTAFSMIDLNDAYLAHAKVEHDRELIKGRVWFSLFSADLGFDMPLYYGGIKLGTWPEIIPVLSTNLDFDLQFNWSPWEGNLLIAGANYRWLTFISDSNDPTTTHQHRMGVLVQDEQKLFDQLSITAGVRLDYNTITPLTLSPRAAVVWRFVPTQILRLAAGQAFRKPSFFNTTIHLTEVQGEPAFPTLRDFFRRNFGNDELRNEDVTALELGYRGRFLDGTLTAEADVFLIFLHNNIGFTADVTYDALGLPDIACPADPHAQCASVFRWENNDSWEKIGGGTLSLTWQPKEDLWLNGHYTFRKTENRGVPKHIGGLSGTYRHPSGLSLSASAFGRSDSITRMISEGSVFGTWVTMERPVTFFFNASAAWRINLGSRWLELGVRGFNLTNAGFRDAAAVTRFDGQEVGGQLMGRQLLLFARGDL
ncbi:TonB-dependent receptor plug domain-containing protein [Myxococcota bacterium]